MPIARFQMPDGRVARFEVPDGTTPDQAMQMMQAHFKTAETPEQQAADMRRMADPTAGMSTSEKLLAGVGKAFSDVGTGIGQLANPVLDVISPRQQTLSNLVTGKSPQSRVEEGRQAVEEERQLSAPLMKTGAGLTGNILGNVALIAPTAVIPGAATIPGAAAIGAATGLVQPSTSASETALNVGLGGVGGAAGQYAANKLPGLVQSWAGRKAAETAAKEAGAAQKFEAARRASQMGYVIPPADLNPGALTEAISGLSGKIKTAQVASQRNQAVTDKLARQALGLGQADELSADVLQGIRQRAGQAYDAIKSTGTVTADKTFMDALDKIAATQQGAGRSFPGLQNNGVTDLVASLKQAAFDAGDAVDATKVLREVADKAYRQGDATLGKAAKSASDALEGVLERHLQAQGATDALRGFQEARKLIAKTYTVQKALTSETGNVSAQKLAQELAKGKPLSGELANIARVSQAFPKATQALKEAPKSVSPLDFAVSGGAAMASQNPLALLALGARPVARNLLLSGTMQRAALNPGFNVPMAARIAPSIANNKLLQLLGMPAGVTSGLTAANLAEQ